MAEIMKISVRIKDSGLVSFLFPLTYLSHSYFLLSFFFSFLTFELRNSVMSCITVTTLTVTMSCDISESDITYQEIITLIYIIHNI